MKTLNKILYLLSSHERKRAFIDGDDSIMALLDMLGVASILPFITVLSNPEIVDTNKCLTQPIMPQ